MLPNGAHVEIDGTSLRIAENVDVHYQHEWLTPFVQRTDISGTPGKQQLFPDRLLWSFDDWSGGEGNNIYYDDEPTRYRYSTGLNPRVRGQLTGRPARNVAFNNAEDCRAIALLASGAGALWQFGASSLNGASGNGQIFNTTDGTTWNQVPDGDVGGTGGIITAATGDMQHVYYATWDNANTRVYRNQIDLSTRAEDASVTVQSADGNAIYASLSLFNGLLYAWTGRIMYTLDVTGSFPVSRVKVDAVGSEQFDDDEFTTNWWAGACVADSSLVYFSSSGGHSILRDYTDGAAGVFWGVPDGFTIRDVAFHQGVVWAAGHWGAAEDPGRGALWGIPLSTRTPTLVHEFRVTTNEYIKPVSMTPSSRDQLLIACEGGEVFMYDISSDAMSLMDTLFTSGSVIYDSDNQIFDTATFGRRRYVLVGTPGAAGATTEDHQIIYYSSDDPEDRQATLADKILEMPDWDYNFPHQIKKLMGFYVTFETMTANQVITLSYSKDSGATYTTLPAITSATTGNSDGRVYLSVSSPSLDFNFYKLRFKVEVESSAGAKAPIVYGITAESRLVPTVQRWKLACLITDEANNQRVRDNDRKAEEIRDALITTKESAQVVLFKDGYRHGRRLESTDYNVFVKDVSDIVTQNGQGYMMLELEETPA